MALTAKHCSSCDRSYPVDAVVCVPCEVIFEERTYLRWVGVTSVVALGLVWWMKLRGMVATFSWPDAFEITAALLLLAYPLHKVGQKLRDPARPVLREMGSVYTSRSDRAMILLLLLFVPLPWLGMLPGWARHAASASGVPFVVDCFVAIAGVIAALAMVIDQGRAFFDFRISNTYVERYRKSQL